MDFQPASTIESPKSPEHRARRGISAKYCVPILAERVVAES